MPLLCLKDRRFSECFSIANESPYIEGNHCAFMKGKCIDSFSDADNDYKKKNN